MQLLVRENIFSFQSTRKKSDWFNSEKLVFDQLLRERYELYGMLVCNLYRVSIWKLLMKRDQDCRVRV